MNLPKNIWLKFLLFCEIYLFGLTFSILWILKGTQVVEDWNESIERKGKKLFNYPEDEKA